MPIDAAGFLNRSEILAGCSLDIPGHRDEWIGNVRNIQPANQVRMPGDELADGWSVGGSPDPIGDIDGEEICVRQKAIDGCHADMVGIDEPGMSPSELIHGGIGGFASGGWFRTDDPLFSIGFVSKPDD